MQTIKTIQPSQNFPFSNAVVHNGVMYVSGQVGFKPGTTTLVSGQMSEQAEQMFANIDQILQAAGTSRDRILRCGVFLRQVERDFKPFNECYAKWLGDHRPARTTVQAAFAMSEILVEMDCIAALA